jgi:hypothetical protein
MGGSRLAVFALIALMAAPSLEAGEAQDRLFAVGVLDGVPTGRSLVFARERSGEFDTTRLPALADAEIAVTLAAADPSGRKAVVSTRDDGKERVLTDLPADAGHPLLVVFLEVVVRDVAALTGGSPFYIHNRIREALADQDAIETVEITRDGAATPGQRLVFRPFVSDANRARLGALADLEIRVTLSDAVPGKVERFEALAEPDAFRETMIFERVEGD